ncbi:MAG: hypothetical protein J6T16_00330 [Opitutales bacterium]|nr:hypothetical protein [Opitutales bacterium]
MLGALTIALPQKQGTRVNKIFLRFLPLLALSFLLGGCMLDLAVPIDSRDIVSGGMHDIIYDQQEILNALNENKTRLEMGFPVFEDGSICFVEREGKSTNLKIMFKNLVYSDISDANIYGSKKPFKWTNEHCRIYKSSSEDECLEIIYEKEKGVNYFLESANGRQSLDKKAAAEILKSWGRIK